MYKRQTVSEATISGPNLGDNISRYSEVIKRSKKGQVTPENIGEIMLSQIPGVSSATAYTIMNKYKNIKSLIKALENSSDTLNDIKIEGKGGKARKISRTCTCNIYNYLIRGKIEEINIDTC